MAKRLNLNDDWEPNEDAYAAMETKQQVIAEDIESLECRISYALEDIAEWRQEIVSLKTQRSELAVEDFI